MLRFSIEHKWCSTWKCMCQIFLHVFLFCGMCVIVVLCFFLQIVFFVMQLLSNSWICKLICTLNCSVECSLDHSLGCNLEYSLGCSLGCNLDCNQDRFSNYNVDCNGICNMQKVMQRNTKSNSGKKNENQLLRFSIEHKWCSTWRCMRQILLHFFCVAECVVLFCFVFFCQSHFLGYAIVKA